MSIDALALALGATPLHATWNLLLARARDVEAATAVVLGISAVIFAPVAAVTWDSIRPFGRTRSLRRRSSSGLVYWSEWRVATALWLYGRSSARRL